MGRTQVPSLASHIVANPYGKPKDIQPKYTLCELCDRTIETKDWGAHKNSRAHRKKEGLKTGVQTNESTGVANENRNNGFSSADGGWGADMTSTQDGGWSSNDNAGPGNGSFDSGSFGNGSFNSSGFASNGNARGGPGGACYGCGEVGHTKRDCPRNSGGRGGGGCYHCGEEGHIKADCPSKPRGGDRTCYNCGKPG